MTDLKSALDIAYAEGEALRGQGKVADYIPALARVDANKLAISVATTKGRCFGLGDWQERFSIQSISKVFTLALALERYEDELWKSVGREPSGSPFNSIVQLESEGGLPRNPFINAGAIAVTDCLTHGRSSEETLHEVLTKLRGLSPDCVIEIDDEVARSEAETGHRNRSLAHFMAAFGGMRNDVDTTLQTYFSQCAIAMSCEALSRASLFLANDGVDPVSGREIVSARRARRINALMMACGHYDNSGEFAFRVGLPGKSGVGGGILVSAPGQGMIAVWSPGLNAAGTSLAGARMVEVLAEEMNWSVFTA